MPWVCGITEGMQLTVLNICLCSTLFSLKWYFNIGKIKRAILKPKVKENSAVTQNCLESVTLWSAVLSLASDPVQMNQIAKGVRWCLARPGLVVSSPKRLKQSSSYRTLVDNL